LAWLGLACWLAASFSFFFIGVGPPGQSIGFVLAGLLAVLGFLLFIGLAGIGVFLTRSQRVELIPIDEERKAAIRRSRKWIPISYAFLFAGLGWVVFATNHWLGREVSYSGRAA